MTSSAFEEGRLCFRKNPDKLTNPHPAGTYEYNEFERGWVQELKRTSNTSLSGYGDRTFASLASTPRFKTSFDTEYSDKEEERKKAAQAYAKAKGG